MMTIDDRLAVEAARQPYPHLFVTVSGAHLYGFPSPDSDFDLRGAHILPVREVIGLGPGRETIEVSEVHNGLEFDLVTHDIKKYFGLLLNKNGYALEQLYSPLIVLTTPEHIEVKELAHGCITRHHVHHYLGFANAQWKLFEKGNPSRVKPLLYLYRVLLTGIHLMQTGEVQANLVRLNEKFCLPYITDLVDLKLAGEEHSTLREVDLGFHRREFERLRDDLEQAGTISRLPEAPSCSASLNALLVRIRLKSL